jgi:hypothetical protein
MDMVRVIEKECTGHVLGKFIKKVRAPAKTMMIGYNGVKNDQHEWYLGCIILGTRHWASGLWLKSQYSISECKIALVLLTYRC